MRLHDLATVGVGMLAGYTVVQVAPVWVQAVFFVLAVSVALVSGWRLWREALG